MSDEREKELLKECARLMDKYNQSGMGHPNHFGLVAIYDRPDGIVCSPMLPSSFLLQSIFAMENASKHLRNQIGGGAQIQHESVTFNSRNIDEVIDGALGHGQMDATEWKIRQTKGEEMSFGCAGNAGTNERYKKTITEMNKRLGITETLPDLMDRDERQLVLESIVKMLMLTENNWQYLVEEGKVNMVTNFLKGMDRDLKTKLPFVDMLPTDFSYNEILDMIKGIEEKMPSLKL